MTDFIDRYCDDSKGIKNHRTILVYLTTKRYLKEFEAENKVKVTFEKIDMPMLKQVPQILGKQ